MAGTNAKYVTFGVVVVIGIVAAAGLAFSIRRGERSTPPKPSIDKIDPDDVADEGGEGSSDSDADAEPEANPEAGEASSGDAAPTSNEQRDALDTFMSITQMSSLKAVQFLEATEWSVGAAISLFMESGGDSVTAPARRHGEERASRSGDQPDGRNSPTPQRLPSVQGDEKEEWQIDPDDAASNPDSISLGRAGATPAEEDETDWIFSVPEGLSLQSDFVETCQICKEQKKWLMVNIQDHEEFACHQMNMDVWSNETIFTLLRGNFVFWQRNNTLAQGRNYIDKYNLDAETLPHIAILDPRTGTQLLKVVGYVDPQDFTTAIVEFLENNTIDQVKTPELKTIGLSSLRARRKKMVDNDPREAGGAGSPLAYESSGSDDYEYEDDEDAVGDDVDDVAQGTSLDGDDTNSRTSTAVGSNANASPARSNTSPDNSARIAMETDGSAAVAVPIRANYGGRGLE